MSEKTGAGISMIQFRMHSNIGVLIIILPQAIVTVIKLPVFGGGQLSISQASGRISRGRLACQTADCVQEQKNLNVEVGWRNQ